LGVYDQRFRVRGTMVEVCTFPISEYNNSHEMTLRLKTPDATSQLNFTNHDVKPSVRSITCTVGLQPYTYRHCRCNHSSPPTRCSAPETINGRCATLLVCIRHPYKSAISDVDDQIKAGKLNTKRSQYSAHLFDFLPVGE